MNKKSKKLRRSAVLSALCLCVICTVIASASYYGEYEMPVIAPFVKNVPNGSSVSFDKSDFTVMLNQDDVLDGIVISALPSSAVLKFDGRELLPFEGIAAESISHLSLTPSSDEQSSATFAFYPVFEGICDACPESYVTVNFSEDLGTAPIAENLTFETYKNISICGKFKSTDLEGGTVIYKIAQTAKLADITVENDGFRYTPYPDKHGKDSFTYIATDDKGNSSEPAEVEIVIKNRTGKSQISYNDMSESSAHYAAIKLAESRVVTGQKIGDCFFFNPEQLVTRSEFVAMAVCAADLKLPSAALNTGLADDDSISVWAKPYVSAALNSGIIQGGLNADGSRVFMPDKNITRAEAYVILNNIASLSADGRTVSFIDNDEIPVWAMQAVINLDSVDVISADSSGAISPNKVVSRADAAEMLYSAMLVSSKK